MTDFTDQLATDATNTFCNTSEWATSVTYFASGATSGSAISVVKEDFVDPGDPTPELRAAAFYARTADVTAPKQGDRILDADSERWFIIRADYDSAMVRLEGRRATVVDYTTAEGTTTSSLDTVFRFFVGALDQRENALLIVSPDDVSDPNEGDYVVISGESERWYVNDVRKRADLFELRLIRTKART